MWRAIRLAGALVALLLPSAASAELDLKRAEVSRLENGLTVIMLEDHSFPVVSTQVLYKSGAKDEVTGKTGLAHFLEHLAFRASRNFPVGRATEAIYDSGGEWHGYTWIDQTTYYSTMPSAGLDLLLSIEADRMAGTTIDSASIDAEKGAVITELHSYENDPESVLLDSILATAFQAHPYRNNTIGYERDVAALTLSDARAFYAQHYSPANAVLAIVGDITPRDVRQLVARRFGQLAARPEPRRIGAQEPRQRGERRTTLLGPVDRQLFQIAYPAPAASSEDLATFLVLQQLLSGGSGVNFRQNDWGTPAQTGTLLDGVAEDLASWFVPTAEPYVFIVKGSLHAGADRARLEQQLERRISGLRQAQPSDEQLAFAKAAVARQLLEDVQTTEDAAHQLAYFEGLGAYDMLMNLSERVAKVTASQVRSAALNYLAPELRTIGWYIPGKTPPSEPIGGGRPAAASERPGTRPATGPAPPPQMRSLSGGLPALVQVNPLSDTATVELLLSAPVRNGSEQPDLAGLGAIVRSGSAAQLGQLIDDAVKDMKSGPAPAAEPSQDPETRLQQMILAQTSRPRKDPRLLAVAVSGAIDAPSVFAALERRLGSVAPGSLPPASSRMELKTNSASLATVRTRIALPLSQGALGYVVPAPPSGTPQGLAWRMLLYILTHDYSGRLGRSAIIENGLAYHVHSAYRTDGQQAWVSISTGVDPARADALEAEFRSQLSGLSTHPPTGAELDAARRHLLGRDISAAQSNEEIAAKLARQFVETGGLRAHNELKAMLDNITIGDVAAAVPEFSRGTILRVDVGASTTSASGRNRAPR